MEWKWYRIKLRHDKGTISIRTYSWSLEAAINLVCNAEGAPHNAVFYAKECK